MGREACECRVERGCESKNRLVLVHLAREKIVVSCISMAVWMVALRMGDCPENGQLRSCTIINWFDIVNDQTYK